MPNCLETASKFKFDNHQNNLTWPHSYTRLEYSNMTIVLRKTFIYLAIGLKNRLVGMDVIFFIS